MYTLIMTTVRKPMSFMFKIKFTSQYPVITRKVHVVISRKDLVITRKDPVITKNYLLKKPKIFWYSSPARVQPTLFL